MKAVVLSISVSTLSLSRWQSLFLWRPWYYYKICCLDIFKKLLYCMLSIFSDKFAFDYFYPFIQKHKLDAFPKQNYVWNEMLLTDLIKKSYKIRMQLISSSNTPMEALNRMKYCASFADFDPGECFIRGAQEESGPRKAPSLWRCRLLRLQSTQRALK